MTDRRHELVSAAALRCAWCHDELAAEGGVLRWDGTGYWPESALPYCADEHRAALADFSAFSRKQYRFAQTVLWTGAGVYLLALLMLPKYRAILTALAALDLGLSFYLYPFALLFLQRRLGVRAGILVMRVTALAIIGAGAMVFFRDVLAATD